MAMKKQDNFGIVAHNISVLSRCCEHGAKGLDYHLLNFCLRTAVFAGRVNTLQGVEE
jgi:hypothetical protein